MLGLQDFKRLLPQNVWGAIVEATDLRPTAKDQVESLGGKWLDVPMSEEEQQRAADAAKMVMAGCRVSNTSKTKLRL